MSPRVRSKFKPDEVVVAHTSFAADGIPHVIVQGTRLRGDDPAVRAAPWAFAQDGTPAGEMPNPWQELREREQTANPPPDVDGWLSSDPQEYEEQDLVALRKDLVLAIGSDGKGRHDHVVTLKRGTRFLRDSEIGRGFPDAFKTAGLTNR